MAARRKTARKGSKKAAGKGARKKAPRRKGAPRKKTRAAKPARKKRAAAAGARKRTARASSGSSIDAIARKIVKYGVDPSGLNLSDLYTPDCTSKESGPNDPVVGLAGLEQKLKQWDSMVEQATFKPRNVLAQGNRVMVEWEGEVRFKNGKSAPLNEVAVHEIRGGKIAAERYYYDPAPIGAAIGGQASGSGPPPQPSRPEPPRYTPSPGTGSGSSGSGPASPVDPLDL